jgi:1-acyl-sn-glycerol-3-phosphate acyltransferase
LELFSVGRSREPLVSLALYNYFKWSVVSPVFQVYFQGKIHGLEKVPKSGPVIIVSNHASYYDPPIVAAGMGRPVSYMAKAELFNNPTFDRLLQLYGAYPVSRGTADLSAIRSALRYLDNGWAAGVFLEGTRTPDGKINNPKRGAALLAAKAKAPLLPVSVWGSEKILEKGSQVPRRVPITVRIGNLIDAPTNSDRQELEAITLRCAKEINEMHDLGR